MKLNKKKISALLGVGLISALTFVPTLNTQAALTAPTDWYYKYTHDGTNFKIKDLDNNVYSTPAYTRTADGAYYNYSHVDTSIFGFTITQKFNRANTTFFHDSVPNKYIPTSTSIGSDSSVGTLTKYEIELVNNTDTDFKIWLDFSSTGSSRYLQLKYNNFNYGINDTFTFHIFEFLSSFIVPSYSTIEIINDPNSSAFYFDAWYLEPLGQNPAWTQGYNVGYDNGFDADAYDLGFDAGFDSINAPNTLLMGFQAMVGILVNFALMIVNLEIFGVSLLNVFSILALFVGVIWILKIIRG